jgi:hypothetical protein
MMVSNLLVQAFAFLFFSGTCVAASDDRSRIFVLTDISNEPDDQESLVRLLAHADLYNVEGLVATTSWWLNDTRYPDHILNVIDGYADVVDNLNVHSEHGSLLQTTSEAEWLPRTKSMASPLCNATCQPALSF